MWYLSILTISLRRFFTTKSLKFINWICWSLFSLKGLTCTIYDHVYENGFCKKTSVMVIWAPILINLLSLSKIDLNLGSISFYIKTTYPLWLPCAFNPTFGFCLEQQEEIMTLLLILVELRHFLLSRVSMWLKIVHSYVHYQIPFLKIFVCNFRGQDLMLV